MKYFLSLIVALVFVSNLNAQSAEDLRLPLDPEVRYATLENGLTYYIRHNEEPKNRASFYMIQNVGAVLEEDHQNGLAHFLEHMAFNGTEHFPEKGIINTLEKHGVAFGYNINAYTSRNETVYNLSEVPVDHPGLMDTCLLVLNDWSNYLLLSEDEIEAERGVISEEWRTRRTSAFRMMKQSLPLIFGNSIYAERDVIGSLDVIQNFEYDAIRSFYHNWYRTDLQAIAVVGDFDVDEMEQKVQELFSKIPAVENPKEREFIEIPESDEPVFGFVTDPETEQSVISWYIRTLNMNQGVEDVMQLREDYVRRLFNRMLSVRMSELLQKGEPPFINGSIARFSLVRNYDATSISVVAKPNEEELAFTTILREVERLKRYGFTNSELELAKSYMLNSMERQVKEKDKISNDRLARQYQSHYLDKEAFLDVEVEHQIMQALLTSIQAEEFRSRIVDWFSEKNNILIVQGPDKEGVKHLSEAEVFALLDAAKEMEVEAPKEEVLAKNLIDAEKVQASMVVSEKAMSDLDAVEWTLENGAKVVYRFADYEKDNVTFRASSKGGSSLYDASYVPSMDMLGNLIDFYGVGDYDQMTLQKMLTGKTVSLKLQLSDLKEGLSGHASPKDIESLMQLIYLRFTQPRFDEEAHQAIIGRYAALVSNMGANPQKTMSDSLTFILSDYHERVRIMDDAYIQDVELEKIEKVYTERFNDASDFTFFFVGNIQKEEMKTLAEKYIGAIPSVNRTESWIDREVNEPSGKIEKTIPLELEVPKATVFLVLNNEMEYSPENTLYLRILKGVLNLRYLESIREEEGGTYGVSSSTSLSHLPDEKARLFITFDTDPEKVDHLKSLVYKELEIIVKDGPTEEDLSKVVKNMLKEREESRAHNAYWMSMLTRYYEHGYNANAEENFEHILNEVSTKDIKKMLKKFYKNANVVDVVFVPAE